MMTAGQGEIAQGQLVCLRKKRLGDAHDDYRWRSEPELSRYDAARPLSVTYHEYLAIYREDLLFPSRYRRGFAIEDGTGLHIGNVMYYNIDTVRQEAELGITIGERDFWGRGYGTEAARLLVEELCGNLGFRRVHLKTLEWNGRARRSFQKVGFVECGRAKRSGSVFVLMEFRSEWLAADRAAEPALAGASKS